MVPVTRSELLALRSRGDLLADEALAALRARPKKGEDLLDLVRAGARAGDPALVRFLDETHALPRWHHPSLYRAGRDAITRHAPISFLVLLAGSLVESFAMEEGAAVLVKTGRLLRDTVPRIYETASLIRDILLPGEERPGGRAHTALLRVRLLHAAVRRFAGGPGWDRTRLGEPVNQMDMLHTLLMFSGVLARGVEALGGHLDDDEKESWCQLWRTAGVFIGVDASLLPADVAEEHALHALIQSGYVPGEASRALASAVLDGLAGEPPFFLPRLVMDAVSRRLVGDTLADGLGLRRSRRGQVAALALVRSWRAVDVLEGAAPGGKRAGVLVGRAFIEGNRWRILRNMPEADYGFRTA